MEVIGTRAVPVESEATPQFATMLPSPLRTALLALFVTALSYILSLVGYYLFASRGLVSAFWPGSALLVSLLLLVSRRVWLWLILAALLGWVLQGLQTDFNPWTMAVGSAVATAEALIAAIGLRNSFDGIPRLNNWKALAKYLFFTVVACLVASLIGAAALPGFYWTNWITWYLGDVLPLLTLTPAILGWAAVRPKRTRQFLHFLLEIAFLLEALIVLGCMVFLLRWTATPAALLFCFVPLLLCAVLRFGLMGVGTAMAVITFLSIWGNLHGRGPFTNVDPFRSVMSLQLFLLSTTLPFIFLAVLVEERQQTHEFLLCLSRSLITAHEQERSRIARELHDDVCQRLAMLSLRIEKVANGWGGSRIPAGDQLDLIRQECSTLASHVQTLSHKLHPSILDNLGLVAAVRSLCREVSEQSGVEVEFTDTNVPEALPREVSLSLFRVTQEALHNALKYSRGKRFEVHLQGEPRRIGLEVSDRGVGFDVARLKNNGGLGLVNMAERVHLVNGTFQVDSNPNEGTRICVRVPLVTAERHVRGQINVRM